ncbi:MAG: LamG domain-containing protein [Sedimentisphaerales bacterium]|nr:LamG domain-containing protein [Sedimentisphaerales bacterium]
MQAKAWFAFAIATLQLAAAVAWGGDFYAYYTKVNTGEPFEAYSRTGDYADIVVAFKGMKGTLVFWRGSSYLPYWQTPAGKWYLEEIVPRSGDGNAKMPDRANTFSHVQIIENTPERVLILWRYLPEFGGTNPHTGMERGKFIEEYFEVTAAGMARRVVHNYPYSCTDWRAPQDRVIQNLKLTATGVTKLNENTFHILPSLPAIKGNSVKTPSGKITPRYCWKLDEGFGSETKEAQSGKPCVIGGQKPFWRSGVSGTALQIDGYTTEIIFPTSAQTKLSDGLTLEAWAAVGAYPWNWAPLVQQGDDKGYFLGVNSDGKPALRILVNNILHELIAETSMQHRRWYHIAGTYDAKSGAMKLYMDGALAASRTITPGLIEIPDVPIQIGKGMDRYPADPVFPWLFLATYAFDGLIDEVRIYDEPLDGSAIETNYHDFKPVDDSVKAELAKRALPTLPATGTFGAIHTHLKYYDAWDNLFNFGPFANVVVNFENSPAKFVFWHGVNYVPQVVGEKGEWYNNEWNETWNKSGGLGCMEPLCDKESFYSHVRVLENTPARVVVHWRFSCVDSQRIQANYEPTTGWSDWADWYYYIYPDGVAGKKMQLYSSGELNHQFQESILVLGPNQKGEDIIDVNSTLVLSDLDTVESYHWSKGVPKGVNFKDKKIQVLNFIGEYDPVMIGEFAGGAVYASETPVYTNFPCWNHWPACQIASDGRLAKYDDRARHSSLSSVGLPVYEAQTGDRPYQVKLLLEGITNKDMDELAVLARSWLQAPEIKAVQYCQNAGYDKSQRAYILSATGADPEFVINATNEEPLYNPAFIVSNWEHDGAGTVSVNGKTPSAGRLRQGVVRDTHGRQQLIVWLEGIWTNEQTLKIKISGASPQ